MDGWLSVWHIDTTENVSGTPINHQLNLLHSIIIGSEIDGILMENDFTRERG